MRVDRLTEGDWETLREIRLRALTTDGAALISLWLMDGNAVAERLYRRAGYAPTGVRMPMPRDRSLTEERWTKLLGEEQLGKPAQQPLGSD